MTNRRWRVTWPANIAPCGPWPRDGCTCWLLSSFHSSSAIPLQGTCLALHAGMLCARSLSPVFSGGWAERTSVGTDRLIVGCIHCIDLHLTDASSGRQQLSSPLRCIKDDSLPLKTFFSLDETKQKNNLMIFFLLEKTVFHHPPADLQDVVKDFNGSR